MSKLEIAKDTVQVVTESAASHFGRIATIVSGAVREVTHEVGEWASDVFEMRDAAVKARAADAAESSRDAMIDDVVPGGDLHPLA